MASSERFDIPCILVSGTEFPVSTQFHSCTEMKRTRRDTFHGQRVVYPQLTRDGEDEIKEKEAVVNDMVTSMKSKLKKSTALSGLCIYRVPTRLRNDVTKAHKPEIVSIGPYHYGSSWQRQAMEDHKWRYLEEFIARKDENKLHAYIERLTEMEEQARQCYAENLNLQLEDFVQIMMLDGYFLVLFMIKSFQESKSMGICSGDPIITTAWIREAIKADMLLLENQLPFSVLEYLFSQINDSDQPICGKLSFLEFSHIYLRSNIEVGMNVYPKEGHVSEVKHLLDLFQKCILPPVEKQSQLLSNGELEWIKTIPSASELYVAGIIFGMRVGTSFLDVRFSHGFLEIPCLSIVHKTDPLLRSLLSFEHYGQSTSYVTDYVTFMANLIKCSSDVDLLARYGIIDISSGEQADVFQLFQNLAKGKTSLLDTYQFKKVYAALYPYRNIRLHMWHLRYYNVRWEVWKAILKRDYFNTPWTTLKLIAAAILLFCTMLQTLYAVFPLRHQ